LDLRKGEGEKVVMKSRKVLAVPMVGQKVADQEEHRLPSESEWKEEEVDQRRAGESSWARQPEAEE